MVGAFKGRQGTAEAIDPHGTKWRSRRIGIKVQGLDWMQGPETAKENRQNSLGAGPKNVQWVRCDSAPPSLSWTDRRHSSFRYAAAGLAGQKLGGAPAGPPLRRAAGGSTAGTRAARSGPAGRRHGETGRSGGGCCVQGDRCWPSLCSSTPCSRPHLHLKVLHHAVSRRKALHVVCRTCTQ